MRLLPIITVKSSHSGNTRRTSAWYCCVFNRGRPLSKRGNFHEASDTAQRTPPPASLTPSIKLLKSYITIASRFVKSKTRPQRERIFCSMFYHQRNRDVPPQSRVRNIFLQRYFFCSASKDMRLSLEIYNANVEAHSQSATSKNMRTIRDEHVEGERYKTEQQPEKLPALYLNRIHIKKQHSHTPVNCLAPLHPSFDPPACPAHGPPNIVSAPP